MGSRFERNQISSIVIPCESRFLFWHFLALNRCTVLQSSSTAGVVAVTITGSVHCGAYPFVSRGRCGASDCFFPHNLLSRSVSIMFPHHSLAQSGFGTIALSWTMVTQTLPSNVSMWPVQCANRLPPATAVHLMRILVPLGTGLK